MDYKMLIIPVVVIIAGVVFMLFMSKKGAKSLGKAQACMRNFVLQEYPCLNGKKFSLINLLEDAINAQHIWVVAYDEEGMRLIPAISNPLNQTLKKYEDIAYFDLKKQLAVNLFAGNKSEENEYIPFSAITDVKLDERGKKITLQIGNVKKSFKYQTKDCFGSPQDEELQRFFKYLRQAKSLLD